MNARFTECTRGLRPGDKKRLPVHFLRLRLTDVKTSNKVACPVLRFTPYLLRHLSGFLPANVCTWKPPNRHMPPAFALFRAGKLLYNDTVNLAVVWNDCRQRPRTFCPTCTPLQRIKNILESIVDAMVSKRPCIEIQATLYFKPICVRVLNDGLPRAITTAA